MQLRPGVTASSVIAIVLMTLVVMMAASSAAYATGYEQIYCGVVKGSGHWCGASGLHSWDWNRAWDDGDLAEVWVCERIWDPVTELAIEQICGYNLAAAQRETNRTCTCYAAHVAHYWGANHVVDGFGRA